MIANPRRLIHFQLEVWEAELAQRMDGTRTVGELVVDHLEGTGDLDAGAVTDLVTFLANGRVPRTAQGRRSRQPRGGAPTATELCETGCWRS